MLWAVWHECPSGAQFIFNYYRHWATMEVRDLEYGSSHFLHSKEGATQGYPLAMIAYIIRFLPFIQELRDAHPYVTKTWYEDDAGAGGNLGKSSHTSGTCRIGGHHKDNYWNQSRVSCS